MAFERNWLAVPPQQFTANGGTLGQIQVTNTRGFRVGMKAILSAVGQKDLQVQIKRVMSDKLILVGPVGSTYASAVWEDVSAYTLASGAYVYAESQAKSKVPANDRDEAVYETEPIVANRVIMVDNLGQYYESSNPLPVQLSDGSITIETLNANLAVQLSHKDNYPKAGDVADSVRIGDGFSELNVNPDGSLNVNVVISNTDGPGLKLSYNEVLAVPAGIETTVLTLVSPDDYRRFQKIEVSGSNVAEIRLKLNGATINKKYLWHGSFNVAFAFEIFVNGFKLLNGQTLTVTAIHQRPDAGDFSATAYFI